MILEICSGSYRSALTANNSGADRVELCSELSVGGITPSHGTIVKTIENLSIPVFVLIRPRGGDFTYSDDEFDIMNRDIEFCKSVGVGGIVSGVLNANFTIDLERTKELIELSKPMPFTFHRAFDWTKNPLEALEQLIELGAARVLTSGQKTTAQEGFDLLSELQHQASGRIGILPACGIGPKNCKMFQDAGFHEIHTTASTPYTQNYSADVPMNTVEMFDETKRFDSDAKNIREILKKIKA